VVDEKRRRQSIGGARIAQRSLVWLTRFATIPEKYWQGSVAIPRQLKRLEPVLIRRLSFSCPITTP
jgi:hypothetical protein